MVPRFPTWQFPSGADGELRAPKHRPRQDRKQHYIILSLRRYGVRVEDCQFKSIKKGLGKTQALHKSISKIKYFTYSPVIHTQENYNQVLICRNQEHHNQELVYHSPVLICHDPENHDDQAVL
jgi:hypothetical protein